MKAVALHQTIQTPGSGPAGLAWDGERLWLNDFRSGRLFWVDPGARTITESLVCPGTLSGLAWDGQSLWQTRLDEPLLQRIVPRRSDIDETIDLGELRQLTDVAWDGHDLWLVSQFDSRLLRLDAKRRQIREGMRLEPAIGPLTFANGLLWLARAYPMSFDRRSLSFQWQGQARHYVLEAVKPEDGAVHASFGLAFMPTGLAWAGDDLWLSQAEPAAIHRCRLR